MLVYCWVFGWGLFEMEGFTYIALDILPFVACIMRIT